MNGKNSKLWLTLLSGALVLIFALSACQPAAEKTPSPEEIAQRVALTQQAAATEAFVQTLIAKVDQLSNQPTWTPQPTYTPFPSPTIAAPTAVVGTPAAPAPQPTAPSGTKCYQMEFLGDVNYPPDTIVSPGDTFIKKWKIKNTGTCTWTTDFDIILVWGDKIGKNGDIAYDVKPGDTYEVEVKVTAPMTAGTYIGYWMMTDNQGARFGYGPGGDYSLAVKIQVVK
ncbi:MAG TPA: NBR1-Ig-like domain-containing protein [Anaerolineaceae bacterium]|nr:NBR1-Ig-like domain-containing protein [Anaerolineaceae bacterium]